MCSLRLYWWRPDNSATTNYIAPIVTTTSVAFLPADGQNVVYDMPHDNDNWVGYSAQPVEHGGAEHIVRGVGFL